MCYTGDRTCCQYLYVVLPRYVYGYDLCGAGSPVTASPVVLQVSDIHTSEHQHLKSHRERFQEFQLFSALVAPRIQAAAAVLTGDLVDSKSENTITSYQSEWEWKAYKNVTEVLLRSLQPSLQVCSASFALSVHSFSFQVFMLDSEQLCWPSFARERKL